MQVVLALKGKDGWERPAVGMPSDVDVDFAGKRVRAGAKVRTLGTFGLKAAFTTICRKRVSSPANCLTRKAIVISRIG